jgi:hypothetical protein
MSKTLSRREDTIGISHVDFFAETFFINATGVKICCLNKLIMTLLESDVAIQGAKYEKRIFRSVRIWLPGQDGDFRTPDITAVLGDSRDDLKEMALTAPCAHSNKGQALTVPAEEVGLLRADHAVEDLMIREGESAHSTTLSHIDQKKSQARQSGSIFDRHRHQRESELAKGGGAG